MEEKKNTTRVPWWIQKLTERDATLGKNVGDVLYICKGISYFAREKGGDAAETEIKKENLREAVEKVMSGGEYSKNPLWDVMMQLRPQVLSGKMSPRILDYVRDILWEMKDDKDIEKAGFAGRLFAQIRSRDINFWRAVIAGGRYNPYIEMRGTDEKVYHYFVGVPHLIGKDVGMKNTTKPDNLQAVVAAYRKMAETTSGEGKKAIEAQISDMLALAEKITGWQKTAPPVKK